MGLNGNASTVVGNAARTVCPQGHLDGGAVPCHGLIDGVVHHFVDEVVQASRTGRANEHPRPFTHGLETFEHRDGIGVVVAYDGTPRRMRAVVRGWHVVVGRICAVDWGRRGRRQGGVSHCASRGLRRGMDRLTLQVLVLASNGTLPSASVYRRASHFRCQNAYRKRNKTAGHTGFFTLSARMHTQVQF